jgi:hypothetical protein
MSELERLQRRLELWRQTTGPRHIMIGRAKAMRELEAEISVLRAAEARLKGT